MDLTIKREKEFDILYSPEITLRIINVKHEEKSVVKNSDINATYICAKLILLNAIKYETRKVIGYSKKARK